MLIRALIISFVVSSFYFPETSKIINQKLLLSLQIHVLCMCKNSGIGSQATYWSTLISIHIILWPQAINHMLCVPSGYWEVIRHPYAPTNGQILVTLHVCWIKTDQYKIKLSGDSRGGSNLGTPHLVKFKFFFFKMVI